MRSAHEPSAGSRREYVTAALTPVTAVVAPKASDHGVINYPAPSTPHGLDFERAVHLEQESLLFWSCRYGPILLFVEDLNGVERNALRVGALH